jgi:hypothetical protein
MFFDPFYRILSFLISIGFLTLFGFASVDFLQNSPYRKVSLIEFTVVLGLFFSAVVILSFTLLTLKYGKRKKVTHNLIDNEESAPARPKRKKSLPFYLLSALNMITSICITLFFGYGFALNFLNGNRFNQLSLLPFIILSTCLLFGTLQFTYTIRMVIFHRRLKA